METNPQFMDIVAREKTGNIPEWEPYYYEAVTGGVIVKGGIPRLITRGPRKGMKTWDTKTAQTTVVSGKEIIDAARRYEEATGKCAACMGEAETPRSWSVDRGVTMRPCRICNGTGRAVQQCVPAIAREGRELLEASCDRDAQAFCASESGIDIGDCA